MNRLGSWKVTAFMPRGGYRLLSLALFADCTHLQSDRITFFDRVVKSSVVVFANSLAVILNRILVVIRWSRVSFWKHKGFVTVLWHLSFFWSFHFWVDNWLYPLQPKARQGGYQCMDGWSHAMQLEPQGVGNCRSQTTPENTQSDEILYKKVQRLWPGC
jgi:hypothetical protein